MYTFTIIGWLLAFLFIGLYIKAAFDWDKAQTELTYLQWRERMRLRREKGENV